MSDYDTRAGIDKALQEGLKGFTSLIRERGEAGYRRHESLTRWLVYGRYYFDGCGNVYTLEEPLQDLPRVCRAGELKFHAVLRRLPTAEDTCTRCGRAWTVHDAHDSVLLTEPSRFYHKECRSLEVHERVRGEFSSLLSKLGSSASLRAVPNRYGSGAYAGPWFLVDLERLGTVRLGWRHRVIEIEWGAEGPNGHDVFADESVTKGRNYVHARSYDDVARYLVRLWHAVPPSKDEILAAGREVMPGLKWDKIAEVFDRLESR